MAGLEDLYREIILDHYRTPRNRGELEAPAVSAEGHNPLCGDEIRIFIDVKDGKFWFWVESFVFRLHRITHSRCVWAHDSSVQCAASNCPSPFCVHSPHTTL